MMIDTKQLLDKFMGSGMAGGLAGGLAGGALTGLLANKKGREIAGSALKVGGIALAGGLAYKAYQSYRNKQSGALQTADTRMASGAAAVDQSAFIPPNQDVVAQQSLSLLLLKAMISAAKADGNIDHGESSRIMSEINRLRLEPEEKALLFDEYSRPVDIQALAAEVQTQEQAVEVYAASLLVIDEQDAREAQYLQSLAAALGLTPALADEIQQTLLASLSGSNQQVQVA
jgi:uncharacterized membrane protein YebE (DUF533 family)